RTRVPEGLDQGHPMLPRFDGYYLSDRQRSEEWHAGVHMVEEYFDYLKLFESGVWLRKNHPTQELDFGAYLAGVTDQAIRDGLEGNHPHDQEYDFLHQTGRFSQNGDRLEFLVRLHLLIMHEVRWSLRIVRPELLLSDAGVAYVFRPSD